MPQDVYIYDPDVSVPAYVPHIEIPEGITVIREGAFWGCSGLQSVTIPDGVTTIESGAFYRCSGLRSITIPDSVTKIGFAAFQDCSALQSITIPDGITEIESAVFCDCAGLQSVTMPDNITKIDDYAFSGCFRLQSVTIPESVTVIGRGAFNGCDDLRSVTIPDGITEIGEHVFYGCFRLQSITIPNGLKKIGEGAFFNCAALQSVTLPDSVTEIGYNAFFNCTALQSVTLPESVTKIDDGAFSDCSALQALMFRGVNILPFININGYGVNTFNIIRTLMEHRIPLNESNIQFCINLEHQGKLSGWIREYPIFGKMRLSPAERSADGETEERLRRCFTAQKKTKSHIPDILDRLAVTVCACKIPPERLAGTFDIEYTRNLLSEKVPIVPAEACRCYYDRGTCNMLIRKGNISVMAEAIALYNGSGHRECYKHLMDFIVSHPDTRTEDLQYAADHAEEIPMRAGTTLTQVRQHRTYMESLAEVEKIEEKYRKVIPEFRLSDYQCSIDPVSITYDGMTARVLDLSDEKDIALAAKLGDLTNCCQRLGRAGETAMMHGFLNPDAGFWVIEGKDGTIKAQAEIWIADNGTLVFDNIEFANTDIGSTSERIEQLGGVIAEWAAESGYGNIIMGCGYNEIKTDTMEQAPAPKLCLTPEEVFTLQRNNNAGASFDNVAGAGQYMQTGKYDPRNFVYTDADQRCVYIKKNGTVSERLTKGCRRTSAANRCTVGHPAVQEQDGSLFLI